MPEYVVTFGDRYRDQEHPRWLLAHPDGFAVLEADNPVEARHRVVEVLGQHWAFIYSREHFDKLPERQWYTRGELGRLDRA